MASGTTRFTLTPTPQRIDDSAAYVSGLVITGQCSLFYMPGTTTPVSPNLDDGMPLQSGDPFSFAMGSGESLWALGEGTLSVILRAV